MTDDNASVRDHQAHRTYLALLLAVLDGDCDQRTHQLLCHTDPHHAADVAHHAAHTMVNSIDPADHDEMRADITTELLHLAGTDDAQTG
ncbi:hypothetical protein FXF53_20515 [Micromonospora sp. WP24]|uniref:hypothetical protein n=1 Tax=Micromonospora sp. WP24 TaxID=2604469 RepID=UPI0011D301CC|nr:hypothetical protein [Micromonospora sp. WP24]TYB97130.1 hypothetical protein FXF53_20515 [Micromonospora sp. WP24]